MKRNKQGRVAFQHEKNRYLLDAEGLQIWCTDAFMPHCWVQAGEYDTQDLLGTEKGRAKLTEAITALDKPYSTVNVSIPPQHRAVPRGNSK